MVNNEELKEYLESLEGDAKSFKLNGEDVGNLFDLFLMIDDENLKDTLQANKMLDWFNKFHTRLEKVVLTR